MSVADTGWNQSSSEPRTSLSGFVERVTFHNEETGFCVLRVKVRGERDLVTVVGSAPSVSPGEYLTASGVWALNKDYGKQFKADYLKISPPTNVVGIEKYLGSGMVKGIGPVYAKRLVKAFGTKVFDVIEKEPERLFDIDGIGEKRVKAIKAGWKDQKAVREIMIFLHSHKISTSRSVRIYKTYGEDAIQKVSENPYRLAQDIRGIGFKTADVIAQNLGIDKHSDIRARAGILYVLEQLTEQGGHTCYPKENLCGMAAELLDIPANIVENALEHEINNRAIIEDEVPAPHSLFPSRFYFAELAIASHLKRLLGGRKPCPDIDGSKALPWVEKKIGLTLSPSQRKAVETALSSKVMVITGGPGVGKTTIVKSIITILGAKGLSIRLCAPTGRAAKRLSESSGKEAKTLHRLLEVDPKTGRFKHDDQNPLDMDVLVVDECSMIDVGLACSLLKAVPSKTIVIFAGDVDQLPSVGPGKFLTDLIDSHVCPVIRLTEIFRQAAASRIIQAAHQINGGFFPKLPAKGESSDFYFVTAPEKEQIASLIVSLVSQRLPKAYGWDPIHDIQVLCPMNRGGAGARAVNELLQQALNDPSKNVFVERFGNKFGKGDKVMQTVNNYDRDVFNGDIGYIDSIDLEEMELAVDFDGRLVTYPFGELDELVLCYATTIHKSQGSEYPVVVIPVTMQHFVMLKRNLLYTGVTRGKKLVVLVGEKRALAMAVKEIQTNNRKTGLKDRLAALRPASA